MAYGYNPIVFFAICHMPYAMGRRPSTIGRARYNVAMKIALGADHAGFELKDKISSWLAAQGIDTADLGTNSPASVDYPDYARRVADAVAAHRADLGILVCGTGIGMAISANKVPGIRAANADSEFEAQMAREHNDANILTLGARVVNEDAARKIVGAWLHAQFAAGRHQTRVDKIMAIEKQEQLAADKR
jgi:ribose 5-phosphate isomerase B